MNSISQPLKLAAYILLGLALAVMLGYVLAYLQPDAPLWPLYVYGVLGISGTVFYMLSDSRYRHAHAHGSVIKEVWAEQRDVQNIVSLKTVEQMDGDPRYTFVMFTLESGKDTYRLEQDERTRALRTGDFVLVERKLRSPNKWTATLLRAIPGDEWKRTGVLAGGEEE